jgi:hypothetical protein
MKSTDGRLSADQIAFRRMIEMHGGIYIVHSSSDLDAAHEKLDAALRARGIEPRRR